MFFIRRPSAAAIERFLALPPDQPLSYDFAGQTKTESRCRDGFILDRARVYLGQGPVVFERGKQTLRQWRMFPPAITQVYGPAPAEGSNVAILYWAAPVRLWMLFLARVVYELDEVVTKNRNSLHRFGFANGTLAGHAERGEERFMIEWRRDDDSVWYDLLAISQPAHWLARL